MAFALAACGRGSDDGRIPANKTSISSPIVSQPIPTPAPTPAPIPWPSPTPSPITGANCGGDAGRGAHFYSVTGVGNVSRDTTLRDITADQLMRVSIEPLAAGPTEGTGGTANYTMMALSVELLKDGVPVPGAKYRIPNKETETYSGSQYGFSWNNTYRRGINVGVRSAPDLADFSSFIKPSDSADRLPHYSIRVSQVYTNKKCQDLCNTATMCTHNAYNPCYGQASQINFDYFSKTPMWCAGQCLAQCQVQQCGVGTVMDNATWSVNVRVETDSTKCITPY
jgi:hypothetical protein